MEEYEDNWVDVGTVADYNYTVKCDFCSLQFCIQQLKQPLNNSILNYIIVTAHKNNTYDYYSSYRSGVQIECEIIGNTPCNNILKVN